MTDLQIGLLILFIFIGLIILIIFSVLVFEPLFPKYHALWDEIEGSIDGDYYTYPGYAHNQLNGGAK